MKPNSMKLSNIKLSNMKNYTLCLFILTGILFSCQKDDLIGLPIEQSEPTEIEFQHLEWDFKMNCSQLENIVVRNSTELFDYLNNDECNGVDKNVRYDKGNSVVVSIYDEIDFEKETLVGVFMGIQPNGCYDIYISSVIESKEKIIIQYKEGTPTPEVYCTLALVNPSYLAKIPKTDKPIEFVKVKS